jgi:basic amino acid/polyamine antiporter, APA family
LETGAKNSPMNEPLPRSFGSWTGALVTVASMVGVGILTTSGYTIQATESAPTLLLLWTIGGVLSLCGALAYAEMATGLPRAGGDYVFVREAYGDGVAFAYGWATFLLGFAAPTALIAHACVIYLTMPWHAASSGQTWPGWITPAAATGIVLAITALHCGGQRVSAWGQNVTTALKIGLLCLFVAGGFAVGDWSQLTMGKPLADQEFGVAVVSLIYVFYAYLGWNASVYLAGEMDDPQRSLPRAILGGGLLVMLLYLALNMTYLLGIGPEGLRNASHAEVEAIAETAGRQLFGPRIAGALSVLIGCGVLASVSAYLLTGSRIGYAMACDGLFPAYAARLSQRYRTPARATITLGLSAVALLWISHVAAGAADAFRSLLNYTTVGLVLLTSLAVTALFVLRRRGLPASFRVPLYPLPPLAFLLITGVLMYYAIRLNPVPTFWGTLSVLSGWPVYVVSRRWRR